MSGIYGSSVDTKVFQPFLIKINKEDLKSVIDQHGLEWFKESAVNTMLEAIDEAHEANS